MKPFMKKNENQMNQENLLAMIDRAWWLSAHFSRSKDKYDKSLKSFTKKQRLVYALLLYLSEVMEGGHGLFYCNFTGIIWEDALKGAKLVGLNQVYDIIQKSVERFGTPPSFEQEERSNAFFLIEQGFEDLDNQFFQLNKEIKIIKHIRDYMVNNLIPFPSKEDIEIFE